MRRLVVAAAAMALAMTACTSSGESVPSFTVGGTPDSQRSLTPAQVVAARRAAGIADCPASNLSAPARDGGLPALTLNCLGGDRKVNLAGLATGKPYVVNLWAQWCGPCLTEAPFMAEVAGQTRGRVEFLGIDSADPFVGKAIDFAQREGTTYAQLSDPKRTARGPLQATGLPWTLLVAADGRIVHRQPLPYRSADALRADIKQYLGVTP